MRPTFLSMRSRMVALCLTVGLVPLLAVATISYAVGRSALHRSGETAERIVQEAVYTTLEATLVARRDAIERYFATIRGQATTLATDRMIVDGLRDLTRAFRSFRGDVDMTPARRATELAALERYYLDEFDTEYRRQNDGRGSAARECLAALDDDTVALQHAFIAANPNPLGSKHLLDGLLADGGAYGRLHGKLHPPIRQFLLEFGYYDVFLADSTSGTIVYTVFKELDFGTSLRDGPYAGTNLGEAFRRADALKQGGVALVDFKQYPPSYDAAASFIATPIFDGETRLGVLLFQMPLDTISAVMSTRAGLGDGGDAYLVGADRLLRSNSHQQPTHTVQSSFRDPQLGAMRDDLVTRGLAGASGRGTHQNFAGATALAAFTPVDVAGQLTWTLVVDTPQQEALAAVTELQTTQDQEIRSLLRTNALAGFISAALIVFVAMSVASRITRPLRRTVAALHRIADGDLTTPIVVEAGDEIGQMAGALNRTMQHIRHTLQGVKSGIDTLLQAAATMGSLGELLASSAQQTSTRNADVSRSAHEVSENIQTLAAAAHQMSEASREIARSTVQSSKVASEAAQLMERCQGTAQRLGASTQQVGEATKSIFSISAQTKELATQAARQARLATEAGKGFGVVAYEVKELAKGTSSATDDITSKIQRTDKTSATITLSSRRLAETTHGATITAAEVVRLVADAGRRNPAPVTSADRLVALTAELDTGTASGQSVGAAGIEAPAAAPDLAGAILKSSLLARAIGTADQLCRDIRSGVESLEDNRGEIRAVLSCIHDIARQTNLLALNATIEAGRAGAAAEGFGDLVRQVTDLSDRSAKTTDEITAQIQQIQTDSTAMIESVDKVRSIVTDIQDHASSIAAAVEQQTATTGEISRNVTGVATASTSILASLAGVKEAADTTATASEQTRDAAADLNRLSESLRGLVEHYVV